MCRPQSSRTVECWWSGRVKTENIGTKMIDSVGAPNVAIRKPSALDNPPENAARQTESRRRKQCLSYEGWPAHAEIELYEIVEATGVELAFCWRNCLGINWRDKRAPGPVKRRWLIRGQRRLTVKVERMKMIWKRCLGYGRTYGGTVEFWVFLCADFLVPPCFPGARRRMLRSAAEISCYLTAAIAEFYPRKKGLESGYTLSRPKFYLEKIYGKRWTLSFTLIPGKKSRFYLRENQGKIRQSPQLRLLQPGQSPVDKRCKFHARIKRAEARAANQTTPLANSAGMGPELAISEIKNCADGEFFLVGNDTTARGKGLGKAR
ncbi:hypothetical protein B0H17DRAFT_1179697 [Mycena rosella]|uniref:Uncharacterized protein n=1 Tax=Mycena rosella TaxID=1033263 RepID=A0AAD7DGZ8_MYCRO|nr:hypothetical protein B0H17DRAFT_1179697 [Mycena rosella]